ncbi:MAG: dTMP kinase [Lactobacillaceae bacterium]|jgi:dTMP kinase|nr:dTMP kinase [Lactobacillaceae bacterium]
MKGVFITFEGGEGSGKSSQIRLLSEYLKRTGFDNITTREPGGTDIGKELRKMLLIGDTEKFDAVSETLLFYTDRRLHLTNKIWPAMARGKWVISDRFADSTIAYQYYGHGKRISMEDLESMYRIVAGDFKPDLTIILDIAPEVGLKRSYAKADTMVDKETRFESIGLEFHNNIRNGYLQIAKNNPERCVVLDADKTIEELHKDIIRVVEERFVGKQLDLF